MSRPLRCFTDAFVVKYHSCPCVWRLLTVWNPQPKVIWIPGWHSRCVINETIFLVTLERFRNGATNHSSCLFGTSTKTKKRLKEKLWSQLVSRSNLHRPQKELSFKPTRRTPPFVSTFIHPRVGLAFSCCAINDWSIWISGACWNTECRGFAEICKKLNWAMKQTLVVYVVEGFCWRMKSYPVIWEWFHKPI